MKSQAEIHFQIWTPIQICNYESPNKLISEMLHFTKPKLFSIRKCLVQIMEAGEFTAYSPIAPEGSKVYSNLLISDLSDFGFLPSAVSVSPKEISAKILEVTDVEISLCEIVAQLCLQQEDILLNSTTTAQLFMPIKMKDGYLLFDCQSGEFLSMNSEHRIIQPDVTKLIFSSMAA